MEQYAAMSSGSVVFALPHLREAIFFYHAEEIVRLRKAKLDAIDRPVGSAFWSANAANYRDEDISRGLAAKHRSFVSDTNLLCLMQALGLEMATYLDVLASRKEDLGFWLGACSRLGPSQKWTADRNGRYCRLQAVPSTWREGRPFAERADSTAAEAVYYGAGGCLAQLPGSPGPWHESCGLNHLLRDHGGRTYIARLVDLSRQSFVFEAAAKQPDLLYSPESPFWPIYDAVEYSAPYEIGVIITQMPPFPLSRLLAPGQTGTRDELRRVLERMQDLFQHLVTLEEHGVTLNGTLPVDSWVDSLYITSTRFCLLPAYLHRIADGHGTGRLARADRYEEQLPAPPVDAWPVAPFEGEGGMAGLPWSQATAYSDPRVRGPRVVSIGTPGSPFEADRPLDLVQQYLHEVVEAYYTDGDKFQFWKQRGIYWGALITDQVHPANRYHSDLLSFTDSLLRRFFPGWGFGYEKITQLLRSGALADAYEECIAKGHESSPCVPERGHSGLFSLCVHCHAQRSGNSDFGSNQGKLDCCPTCRSSNLVNAMPKAIQDLLLRIIQPETNQDGTPTIVTAREALTTIDAVMATELPRMLATYQAWVDKQKKVVRMVTAPRMPLSRIDIDIRKDRLLLLELMRGSFMDVRFTRKNKGYREARDIVKAFLDSKKVEAEAEASRAGASSTSASEAEAAAAASLPVAAVGSSKTAAKIEQDEDEETAAKKAKVA